MKNYEGGRGTSSNTKFAILIFLLFENIFSNYNPPPIFQILTINGIFRVPFHSERQKRVN